MAAKGSNSKRRPPDSQGTRLVSRPLDALFFLLPLILFYEIACLLIEPHPFGLGENRVVAYQLLRVAFEVLGSRASWLPGFAVIVILLACHVASRQPWGFRKWTVGFMYVESLAWALPLLAINHFTQMAAARVESSGWLANTALSVGAGVYEELLFRLILIPLVVIVGADLMRFSTSATTVGAVLLSAVVFAMHHHPPLGNDPFDALRFGFRFIAGVYLGTIFVFRGYGPAAGTHIAHNCLILAWSGA